MRKLLSVLLVLAMVLGLASTAFAATDVSGTKYDAAVTRLNALAILKGYEDGSFKPSNNITRAEFAAVAVRALGLEDAAKNTVGATKFSDVPATHWAAGYINVAVGRGIIKGYPDGTFKPSANVTNAEAMAMLIRVLGYEPAVVGEWPMNYVSKAAEIGLTSGLTLGTEQPAIRGDVALMTDKALTIPLMEQNQWGTLTGYNVTDKTLLTDKLGMQELKGAIVTATPLYDRVGLKSNEIMLSADEAPFTFDASINVEALLGHKVDAWANDGNIFYIVDKTAATKVVTMSVTGADADELTLTNDANTATADDDTTYTLADGYTWYYNHTLQTAFNKSKIEGSTVTMILDSSNKVTFFTALKYDGTFVATKVTTGTSPKLAIADRDGAFNGTTGIDLKNKTYTIVDATGKAMQLGDIKANDVVSVASQSGIVDGAFSGELWLRVVRNSVTGTITKVRMTDDEDISTYKVYVGDTAYGLNSKATTRVDNAYEGLTAYVPADDPTPAIEENITSLVGQDGVFYLDAAGKIYLADLSVTAADQLVAFVNKVAWNVSTTDGTTEYVKLLKLDGTKETLPIDVDDTTAVEMVGNFVEYTVDSDGVIDSVTLLNEAPAAVAADATYDRVAFGGKTYVVTADTKFYTQTATLDDEDAITGYTVASTTLATVRGGEDLVGFVQPDANYPNRAAVVVVTFADGTNNLVATADIPVMVKDIYKAVSGTTTYTHIVVDEVGTEKDYVTSGADLTGIDAGMVVTLDFNSAGKVTTVTPTEFDTEDYVLKKADIDVAAGVLSTSDVDGTVLTTSFKTKDTVVYDVTGEDPVKVDFNALAANQTVSFTVSGSNIVVVVITDK